MTIFHFSNKKSWMIALIVAILMHGGLLLILQFTHVVPETVPPSTIQITLTSSVTPSLQSSKQELTPHLKENTNHNLPPSIASKQTTTSFTSIHATPTDTSHSTKNKTPSTTDNLFDNQSSTLAQSNTNIAASNEQKIKTITPANGDEKKLNNPKPIYPTEARDNEEEGTVVLTIYVLSDGSVGEVKLKKSSGYFRLDDSAIYTIKSKWRFIPATQNGQSVNSWHTQKIHFHLSN